MALFVSSTAKDGQKEARNTRSKTQDNKDKRSRVSLEVSSVSSWHLLSTPSFRHSFLSRHVVDDFVRQLFEEQILSRNTNHNNLFGDFCRRSIKTWKTLAQLFQVLIHVPWSLPSVAIDDRNQRQCLNIIVNDKISPLFFGSQLMRTRF